MSGTDPDPPSLASHFDNAARTLAAGRTFQQATSNDYLNAFFGVYYNMADIILRILKLILCWINPF